MQNQQEVNLFWFKFSLKNRKSSSMPKLLWDELTARFCGQVFSFVTLNNVCLISRNLEKTNKLCRSVHFCRRKGKVLFVVFSHTFFLFVDESGLQLWSRHFLSKIARLSLNFTSL